MSEADELLKYKELLESGIITKEEFEKKKNEILGTNETKIANKDENIKEKLQHIYYIAKIMDKNNIGYRDLVEKQSHKGSVNSSLINSIQIIELCLTAFISIIVDKKLTDNDYLILSKYMNISIMGNKINSASEFNIVTAENEKLDPLDWYLFYVQKENINKIMDNNKYNDLTIELVDIYTKIGQLLVNAGENSEIRSKNYEEYMNYLEKRFKEMKKDYDEAMTTIEAPNSSNNSNIVNETKTTNINEDNKLNNVNPIQNNTDETLKLGKVNKVVSWILFAFFGLATLGGITSGTNFITLLIDVLCALICCPPLIEKAQEMLKKKIQTYIRVIAIFVLFAVSGAATTANYKPNVNNTSVNVNSQQNIGNNQNQVNPVFVANTDGKGFFQKVLCADTQCEYREPMKLKADSMIPYDTVTYTTGNGSYSFEVTTNTKNEIANIQMFFYKYGTEDPTNYFMIATKLKYPNSNTEQLTSFINENIGKDEKIKIGDFTFHIFNGTSDNCVILDIYTDEFAKINGNQ